MPARSICFYLLTGISTIAVLACTSPASDELAAAREALGRGRYREAIERYTEVTIQAPGSPEAAQALYDLALIHYLKRRDLDAARSTFRKVLTSYPESAVARDARRLLGRMYEQDLGEPEKAIREYELLLEDAIDPAEKKSLLLQIANCRYNSNEIDLAAEGYRRVIERFPRDEESDGAYLRLAHIDRLNGRAEEAVQTLETLLGVTEDADTRRKAYLMQAEALGDLGRYGDAQTCLTLAEEEFPGDPEISVMASRLREQEEAQRSVASGGELEQNFRWGRARP